jgi:hypothetical protein
MEAVPPSRRARVSPWAVLLVVVLVLIAGTPRFATHRDIDVNKVSLTSQPNGWYLHYPDGRSLGRFSFDNYSYIASVEYFRGDYHRYPIYGPWRWRLVPSWIAAQTPIDNPAVAFAAVSLAFAVIGGASLVVTPARNGLRRRGQMVVAVLFALSFPMFWYGTSGYVDTAVVAMLCVGLMLIQSRRWWLFLLLLPFAFLVKETYLLIVPVAAVYMWARSTKRSDWLPVTVASLAVLVVMWFGVRWALPTPRTLGWIPNYERFQSNVTRPEAVGSFLLTCGVVIPLALVRTWILFTRRSVGGPSVTELRENLHLVVGAFLGLTVSFHGFLTAYADGRHAWTAYPFAVILSAQLVMEFLGRRAERSEAPVAAAADPGPDRTS